MSYLQQYLNEIEAEAAEKSRLACANAALIELAGDIVARINACGERDVVFPTYHLDCGGAHASVTLQKDLHVSNDTLIDALEIAGFPICHLPARVHRSVYSNVRHVYLMIAPGVELLIEPPLPRNAAGSPAANAAATHQEALPCAA